MDSSPFPHRKSPFAAASAAMLLAAATGVQAGGPQPEGHPNAKSIGIYIGSELTADGATLLAGFGHEPSSHWLEIVPAQAHPEGATIPVGVTGAARIPGELTPMPQARRTFKYITSNYSEFAGFPPPLTNGGLNEHGVAARDIWAPARPELVAMAREAAAEVPQTGPSYSDLARAAMERARSAREAAALVGRLIDAHGFSTYGGNSHLFADENEAWVFINYPYGGLWAAERVPADEVRVLYPGYLREFPVDHEASADHMASEHLVPFAREQGWWDGESPFDLQAVYGQPFPAEDPGDFYPAFYVGSRHPLEREAELRAMAPISLAEMIAYVRDPRWSTDFSGYGQVAHIRPDAHPELQTLWVAVTSGITTPFLPVPIGAESVPPEFSQHRYMTRDAASHFIDPDYGPLEATRYATRTFKRLLYHTCEHPQDFLHRVTGEIETFEASVMAEWPGIEQRARELYGNGKAAAARAHLTEHVHRLLLAGLDLGDELVRAVEAETRERYGIRMPAGEREPGDTTPATSQHMARQGWGAMIHCYDEALDEYPREHGIYNDAADLRG